MERIHSLSGKEDVSKILAVTIGPFLATAGVLKLVLGRWWVKEPASSPSTNLSSSTAPQAKPQVPTAVLNITSVIEVLAGIGLVYAQLRLFAAIVLLCMIAFLEFENRRRGVQPLGWAFRVPALVVTIGLVVILILETGEGGRSLGLRDFWEGKGSWGIKRWAGLEGREVGFDF